MNRIEVIDAHTAGEPLRLMVTGVPIPSGSTMNEKRAVMKAQFDHYRTALMLEPRGHADMYGCLLTEPVSPDGDHGVLFLHNEGYSTMCGHGIIALATILLESGMTAWQGDEHVFRFDTPAGRITATAYRKSGRVAHVSFENVPAWVVSTGHRVEVPDGEFRYDIAFGGAFYAVGPSLHPVTPENGSRLALLGTGIKQQASGHRLNHPEDVAMEFLYGVIFTDRAVSPDAHSRNVCIFADGELDRSPTGTGVSARAALHFFAGDIGLGERIRIESILGTSFEVYAKEVTTFGPYPAIVPVVSGSAFITGTSQFVFDERDPLQHGFRIR